MKLIKKLIVLGVSEEKAKEIISLKYSMPGYENISEEQFIEMICQINSCVNTTSKSQSLQELEPFIKQLPNEFHGKQKKPKNQEWQKRIKNLTKL